MAAKKRRMRGTTPEVERRAKDLRRHLTIPEQIVWTMLRKHRQAGFYFRRQHPVERFVVDFCCTKAKLCVEIDGEIYAQQRERDAERTLWLEAIGFKVIRFTNDEVLRVPDEVAKRIRATLIEQAQRVKQAE